MKHVMTTIALALVVSGCTALQGNNQLTSGAQSPGFVDGVRDVAAPNNNFQSLAVKQQAQQVNSVYSGKNINHYIRAVMQDLVTNLQYVNQKTPIAVASFVYLDADFNSTTLLGNQIAEGFVHELHQFGIPVIDFKTTDFMRITPQGDFVFSRDYLELSQDMPFQYVMAGTLVNHTDGVLVNARVVGINSKAVVGTAQGFIPQKVIDELNSKDELDGVTLKRGM
ncbi:FlgO family outer membrane protein [Pseudoalteromonas fenneropenaei]|uniref:FlgO family outer membrane protein n=1 Tax=Pseudoalteromonas fenneropenaei TaxID=1737459 RepID=A0ABV7CH16_9GAMM